MGRHARTTALLSTLLVAVLIVAACGSSDSAEPPAVGPAASASARVPAGFEVTRFASDLDHPTSMVWGPDGVLYVAQQNGDILALADTDGDGVADMRVLFATGFVLPLGLTFVDGDLYVSERGSVLRVIDQDQDGVSDRVEPVVTGLPVGGALHANHQNNGVVLGPDGYLYVGIGIDPESTGADELTAERKSHLGIGLDGDSDIDSGIGHDSTGEAAPSMVDERAGTIIRFRPDGSDLTIYATGFKNPVGLTFDSLGNLFATDIGPNTPEGPDELNYIAAGADYGYPRTADGVNRPGDLPVIAQLEVAASSGVIFYEGTNFPEGYRGNAFIAQWGQAESDIAFANRVVRVLVEERDGTFSGAARSFAVGFEHPIAVAVGPDGALYVADYGSLDPAATESGSVYRIVHVGDDDG